MLYARFLRSDKRLYSFQASTCNKLSILCHFLTDDVSWHGADSFKEWVFDDQYDEVSSNATLLEKENGHIYLYNIWGEIDESHFFKLNMNNYINILDQWKKLMKELPQEIIITLKEGIVSLEGKN